MNKTKTNRGITLVALVITIIVLIILAGVSINAVMNDGLINNAKNAKNEFEEAKTEEQKILSQLEIDKAQVEFLKSGTPYSVKSGFITGINITNGTVETVGTFKASLPEGYDLFAVDGSVITDTTISVKPGMILKKGEEEIGKIVIFGDITGSIPGEINIDDTIAADQILEKIGEFEDYRIVAMDVNHDGVLNYVDVDLIKQAATQSFNINQNVQALSLSSLDIQYNAVLKEKAQEKWLNELRANIEGTQYSLETENDYYLFKGVVAGTKVSAIEQYLPENTTVERGGSVISSDTELLLNDQLCCVWGENRRSTGIMFIDF